MKYRYHFVERKANDAHRITRSEFPLQNSIHFRCEFPREEICIAFSSHLFGETGIVPWRGGK